MTMYCPSWICSSKFKRMLFLRELILIAEISWKANPQSNSLLHCTVLRRIMNMERSRMKWFETALSLALGTLPSQSIFRWTLNWSWRKPRNLSGREKPSTNNRFYCRRMLVRVSRAALTWCKHNRNNASNLRLSNQWSLVVVTQSVSVTGKTSTVGTNALQRRKFAINAIKEAT